MGASVLRDSLRTLQFLPSLRLSGSAGWTNSAGSYIVNPGKLLLSAVGSLTQPLFNKGANIAQLKIAKAQQEEAKLTFQQTVLNAGKEVNDALTQAQTAKGKIDLRTHQIESLEDAVRSTPIADDAWKHYLFGSAHGTANPAQRPALPSNGSF